MTLALKSGWPDVTVSEFGAYMRDIAPKLESANLITRWRGAIALAAWLSDAPEDWLKEDVSRAHQVLKACPWCAQMPEAGTEPVPTIAHNGRTFHHVGNLDTVNIGQLEGLLTLEGAYQEDPARGWPLLLGILYKEQGAIHSQAVCEEAAAHLADLPVTQAWPALAFFLASAVPSLERIQQCSKLEGEATATMQALEDALRTPVAVGGLRGFLWRWQRSAASRWLNSAKNRLTTF